MKKTVAYLAAAIIASATVTTSYAAPRKMIQVAQPSTLSCVIVPFPGTGCPLGERLVGSVLWLGAIGLGIGAVAGGTAAIGVGLSHSAWLGAGIGGGTGVVAPFVVR